MTSQEKVAYLKGLMDGLELDENAKETRLFKAIIDTLADLASDLADAEDDIIDMGEQIDDIVDEIVDWKMILTIWLMISPKMTRMKTKMRMTRTKTSSKSTAPTAAIPSISTPAYWKKAKSNALSAAA